MLIDSNGKKLFVAFSSLTDPNIRVVKQAPERGSWKGSTWYVEPTYAVIDYFRGKARWSARAKEVLTAADELRRKSVVPAPPRDAFQYKRPPLAHQSAIFERSRDREFFGFFMEQGTGKTKIGLDEAAWLFCKGEITGVFITAFPEGVHKNWIYDELPSNLPDFIKYRACAWSTAKASTVAWKRNVLEPVMTPEPGVLDFLAVNSDGLAGAKCYEASERFIRNHGGRVLFIGDESTAFKKHSAKRTKIAKKLASECAYRRIMSGTPSPKSPLDLYSQFEILKPGFWDGESFYAFRSRYAVMKPLYGHTYRGRQVEIVDGYQNLEELHRRIAPHMARVLKVDCLDLPDKVYRTHRVELTPAQRRIYDALTADFLAELDSGVKMTAPLAMTRLMRLHQVCMNIFKPDDATEPQPIEEGVHPRLQAVLDLIEMRPDNKVIVWGTYKHSLRELAETLDGIYGRGATARAWGDIGPDEREAGIKRWRENDACRFIVAHPRSLGYGFTLNEAGTMIYYSNDYSLEYRLQSEDRPHRIGQTKQVEIIDLEAEDTVDTKIVGAHKAKKDLAAIVTGDNIRSLLV
jgi:hypothetical protein